MHARVLIYNGKGRLERQRQAGKAKAGWKGKGRLERQRQAGKAKAGWKDIVI
jgi:hypothetical protein